MYFSRKVVYEYFVNNPIFVSIENCKYKYVIKNVVYYSIIANKSSALVSSTAGLAIISASLRAERNFKG
jgi:hypothetical protein